MRNAGIGAYTVIEEWIDHPAIKEVIVVVDADTDDAWSHIGAHRGALILHSDAKGKGQVVMHGLEHVTTPWVAFCDADLIGLTQEHISLLVADAILDSPGDPFEAARMTIGVPDVPGNYPTDRLWAWCWVSGQRCLPTSVIRPLNLHGYLMETQINRAASHAKLPLNFEWLTGLVSTYDMTERRLQAMEEDAKWGRRHGLL